jgi:hypothetical protein
VKEPLSPSYVNIPVSVAYAEADDYEPTPVLKPEQLAAQHILPAPEAAARDAVDPRRPGRTADRHPPNHRAQHPDSRQATSQDRIAGQ